MAFQTYTGPLWKPSKLDRIAAKQERKAEESKAKAAAQRQELDRQSAIRKACYVRDGGVCRAFGVPLKLVSDNKLELAECHHIVFRSAGGSHEMINRVTLSPKAHSMAHLHQLIIAGDPNGTLTFVERNLETGKVLRMWESTVGA